ncbi:MULTISPECIES: SusC/RagA family TonB-linked outer membrane protein [Niastella]|uniref:SusC/RagA family TonB-linked outer membrane protein n=1 Tax=Niastella soli TaxID=2821487 RepID=A0ABS3Z3G4_9BACT|nr:SusC/RagA family TonB-linked outer membrane protein [Niastella soli]MBO9204707.1 SusC/RagA family TonB-linked outer membrane protein [Niastella soli]
MKKTKLLFAIGAVLLCIGHTARAGENHVSQVIKRDSIPFKNYPRIQVYVKDLSSDTALPKALVMVGKRRFYTNDEGYVVIDDVNKNGMLNVSKIGYLSQDKKVEPTIVIRLTKQERDVALVDFTNGLYQRPLEHTAAAYTVIDGAEIRKVNAISFINVLRYFAPSFIVDEDNNAGSDPNTPPAVKIRGANNFPAKTTIPAHPGVSNTNVQLNPSTGDFVASNVYNPNQPVVLLNGVQVALQSVLDLDVNRIERIVVLKDAAATAAYGARGGNGVLLIQTLRPKPGMMNVTYSGQMTIASPDVSSYHLPDAAGKLNLDAAAGLYTGNDPQYQNRLKQAGDGVNTNWLKVPTRTAMGQRHYLSLEGGDNDIAYGADASYNDMEGVMKGSNRKNINIGGFLNVHVGNVFLTNYLAVTKSTSANSPYGTFSDYAKQNAFWDPIDPVTHEYRKTLELQLPDSFRYFNPAWNGGLSTTSTNDYTRISDVLSGIWNVGYGFKLNGRIGISKQSDEVNFFLPPSHIAFANFSVDSFFKRGTYTQIASEFMSVDGNLNLDYTKKINRHQFYVTTGIMAQQTNSQSAGIDLAGFTSDKLSDLAFGNAYANTRPAAGKIKTRLLSTFGNLAYSYDDRYLLEGTLNTDQSSQFSKNNQRVMHWSAGASWNLHRERFFQPNAILSSLRIYGSVGTTGNLFYQSYLGKTTFNYLTGRQYLTTGASGGLSTRDVGIGTYLTGFGNENLKAPETQQQNAGLDVSLLQNRIGLTVNAYRNTTTNLVLPVASPAYTGFQDFNYYDNGAAIENKGLEFDLNVHVIRDLRKKILWSVRVNGIHNENRVTALNDYLQTVTVNNDAAAIDQTQPQARYVTGESLTGIWAVQSLGIDAATGKEKFLKADGTETFTWDAADKILAGDYAPKWQGSFGTSVTVKNWSADFYCFYQYGASYYNQTLADKIENADLKYNVDSRALDNRWSQPGDNALYKALSVNGLKADPTYVTTRFVEKNNYISNAVVAVRYTLPKSIQNKIRSKNTVIGLAGNNLFRSGGMTAERGIYYPFNRTYTFSLTTSF